MVDVWISADVLTYFGGRLGGLPGQRLDLVRDDREAAAGLAGASGFDRRVERQTDWFARRSPGSELSTPSMRWVAAARLSISVIDFSVRMTGLFDHAGGLADLPADFLDRSRQFFGGAGDAR